MTRSSFVRRHSPGIAAMIAAAIGAILWFWVTQETSVTLNVFFGWRQMAIVACAGIFLGGIAAEFVALVARSPGETPMAGAIIGLIIALPFYAVIVLLGMAAQD